LFLSRLVSPYLTQKSVRLNNNNTNLLDLLDLSSFSYRSKRYQALNDARAFEQHVVRSSSSPALVSPEQKTMTPNRISALFIFGGEKSILYVCMYDKKERAHETVSQKASSRKRFSPSRKVFFFFFLSSRRASGRVFLWCTRGVGARASGV
jgi:hypothetical protein